MTTTPSTFDELSQLQEELARERRLRIAAEAEALAQAWRALEGVARTLPLLVAWADRTAASASRTSATPRSSAGRRRRSAG
jgi:hypothetical protein